MGEAMDSKRPRHYAAEIIALEDREARWRALERVPEHYREWVERLVVDHFAKRAALRAWETQQRHREQQRAASVF